MTIFVVIASAAFALVGLVFVLEVLYRIARTLEEIKQKLAGRGETERSHPD
jgi:hypothetical protein